MTTKILLIDDEARILRSLARLLKLAGYTIITAESGQEGLALYRQAHPDIVLLDLRMPGMDGLAVLHRIRQHDPEANVILCTGHGDKDAVISALRAGASDFLPKPVDQVTLESALRRAEERTHLKRELRASQRALEEQNARLEEEVRARTEALEREIEERKQAHAALQESEEKYRLLAETTQDIIALHDMEGRIVYLNRAGLDLAGFETSESIGKPITAFIPEEDLADVEARRMQRASGDERTYRYETTFVNRDGERIPAEVNSTPILRQGRVSQVLLVARDITERKAVEEAVAEERDRLDTILSTLDTGLSLINPDMTVAWVNRKVRLMFPDQEPVGRRCYAFYESRDTPCENCGTLKAFQTGESQVYERRSPVTGRWYMIISQPIKDGKGDVVNVLEGITDITERKRADEALQESEARYRRLVEGSPDILYVYSDRRGALYWSQRVEEVLGFATADLIESPYLWHDAIHPDDVAAVNEAIEESHKATGFEIEYRIQDVDGAWHWFHDRLINKRQVGDEMIIEGLATDITERKQAEEALRRRNQYLRALQGTTLELISQFDLETLLKNIVSRAASLLGTTSGFLNLVDPETNQLVLRVGVGAVTESLAPTVQLGKGMAGMVWQTGEPVVVNDYDGWANRLPGFSYNTVGAMIGVPLLSGEEVVGVLGLAYDFPSQQTFGSEEIELLIQFARLATVAIENARLLEQTQRDAETKALLLREVNHRVLNNLTSIMAILDMEQRRFLDDEVNLRAVLEDVTNRIRGMTTVHRMLSSAQWAPLDLEKVVEQVIHAALSGSPIQPHVEVEVDAPADPLRVSSQQSITIALVINELTTNSVKYAFGDRAEGKIYVEIVPLDGTEERIRLVFRDDGPGMPGEVLAGNGADLGIWLVESNVQHGLGGEVDFYNDGGAVASITFRRAPLDRSDEAMVSLDGGRCGEG